MTCKKYAALFVLLFMTLAVKAKDYATFNLPVGAVTRLDKGTVKGAKFFHSSLQIGLRFSLVLVFGSIIQTLEKKLLSLSMISLIRQHLTLAQMIP